MSGYLQRLAAAVQRPERRLRPIAGSVFATGSDEPVEAPQATFAVERSAPGPAQVPTRDESTAPAAELAELTILAPEPRRAPDPARASSAEPERAPAPAPPETAAQQPAAAAPIETAATPRPASAAPPEVHEIHLRELQEIAPTPPAQPPSEPTPGRLVESWREDPADAPTMRPQAYPVPPQARQASSSTQRGVPAPAHVPALEREAREDVHIHIGRIEVIAAAAPSPPAPTRPKSTDLKDYLKRGSGRTR